jgi:hypothetical protein
MTVSFLAPSLKSRSPVITEFLKAGPLIETENIHIVAEIKERLVKFTFNQGETTDVLFTQRLKSAPSSTDNTLERLACLKLIIDALTFNGFALHSTDSPVLENTKPG